MKRPRLIFTLFALLGFGLSLATPPEDVPDSAYDESEVLPYEGTPLFQIRVEPASDWIAKGEIGYSSQLCVNSSTKRFRNRRENSARSNRAPVSLTILNHPLRR